MNKSFNIQKLLHRKSKHHGTKPMHPFSLKAFYRHYEHNLTHLGSLDLIITKQNKLPKSFIDRSYNIFEQHHTDKNHPFERMIFF